MDAKKSYSAPTLKDLGDIVAETLGEMGVGDEPITLREFNDDI